MAAALFIVDEIMTPAPYITDELHLACIANDANKVKKLLEGGKDPNIRNEYGAAPLHVIHSDKNLAIANLLLAHGADINIKDEYNNTPLRTACQYEDATNLALRYLEVPEIKADVAGHMNRTPLHSACCNAIIPVIKKLMRRPDVNFTVSDEYGSTPLSVACLMGHLEVVKLFAEYAPLKSNLFVRLVNTPDKANRTPLFVAVCGHHYEIVKFILSFPGVDLSLKILPNPKNDLHLGMDVEMLARTTNPKIAKLVEDYRASGKAKAH